MKKLITTLCIKLLNWTGYSIPVIRPNIISRPLGKRAVAQEKIDYWRLQEWSTHPIQSFDFDKHIRRKVQEAMAERLAGDLEVFTLHTPDGIIYKADIVYCDMAPYEKDFKINDYE